MGVGKSRDSEEIRDYPSYSSGDESDDQSYPTPPPAQSYDPPPHLAESYAPPDHLPGKLPRLEFRDYPSYSSGDVSGYHSYPTAPPPPPAHSYDPPPPLTESYAPPSKRPRVEFRCNPSNSSRDVSGNQSYPTAPPPPPAHSYGPPPPLAESHFPPGPRPRMDRRFSRISDEYHTVEQVTDALAKAGLESSKLIVGIDFTKSNEWTGKVSFGGRSLHDIGGTKNPYEQAISIIGQTLSAFDEDNLIHCFGFGDASTEDRDAFSFYLDGRPCNGFEDALARYRELVPHVRLAGPTSFAPIIEMAMTIVEQSGGQYHVLVVIADGQVTRSADIPSGHLSIQEQKTIDAIVNASGFPLSIILVGVGDGPSDTMKEFDDNIRARAVDNFQFVNFTEIMSRNISQTRKEAAFALAALMEIPTQYKATLEMGILGRQTGRSPWRVPLPPAIDHTASSVGPNEHPQSSSASTSFETQDCPICLTNPRDMAFGCGHRTCSECGPSLQACPLCRKDIETRIKLY